MPGNVLYKYKDVHLNFDQIVLTRYSEKIEAKEATDYSSAIKANPAIKDHVVVISLEKQQRTTFNDAMVQPHLTDEKKLYLNGMKYRDMHMPYNDFL